MRRKKRRDSIKELLTCPGRLIRGDEATTKAQLTRVTKRFMNGGAEREKNAYYKEMLRYGQIGQTRPAQQCFAKEIHNR